MNNDEVIKEVDFFAKSLLERDKLYGFNDPLYLISPTFYYTRARGANIKDIKEIWKRYIAWLYTDIKERIFNDEEVIQIHAHREAIAHEYLSKSVYEYSAAYVNSSQRARRAPFGYIYFEYVEGTKIKKFYSIVYENGIPKSAKGSTGCIQQ